MKSQVIHTVWRNISCEAVGAEFDIDHSQEWKV